MEGFDMTKRLGMAIALGALLTACGGNTAPHSAAASKTFDYGAAAPASTAQAAAVQGAVSGALALKSSPDATQAQDLADFSSLTSALLGDDVGFSASLRSSVNARTAAFVARRAGLAAGADATFVDSSCATVTPTSVTLKGCQVAITDTDGSSITVTADGTLSVAADTLTWDLTLHVAVSNPAQSASASGAFHDSGTLTVTTTAAKGSMRRELTASSTVQGQSAGLGVSESLDFDLTYDPAISCVTGGTLEAKRVWTQRPSGQGATLLRDRGAKVNWTGCGIATVQLSR
jgi:hypothetical protein